jgi:hypothetical protein
MRLDADRIDPTCIWWVTSTIFAWGLMVRMTPFIMATYGSINPKSVVRVIIPDGVSMSTPYIPPFICHGWPDFRANKKTILKVLK